MSVLQITIFFSYIIAGLLFGLARLTELRSQKMLLLFVGYISAAMGLTWHSWTLWLLIFVPEGMELSIGTTVSVIGLQLALIAMISGLESSLRGLSGGMLLLAGLIGIMAGGNIPSHETVIMSMQVRSHILISLFSYGLLTVGAIVAIYALIQEARLRASMFSPVNRLFAPLETTEKLLFGITSAGFLSLLIAVLSGFAFVENLFAQHLVHKTVLSLLALVIFGVLLVGREFAGWRGKRAVYLYLLGFMILCLAYFGSRYILEEILGRSWS